MVKVRNLTIGLFVSLSPVMGGGKKQRIGNDRLVSEAGEQVMGHVDDDALPQVTRKIEHGIGSIRTEGSIGFDQGGDVQGVH